VSDHDLAAQVSGVGLLAEPSRRALYEYVAGRPEAVGRAEAAEATGVPAHTAKFHLDKLVESGLLTTEFRRLTGRSGPGAGRPAKLYRRSQRQVDVSLPRRQYELAGRVLADAVSLAASAQVPVLDAVQQTARETGLALPVARTTEDDDASGDALDVVSAALGEYGYEPRRTDDVVTLANCPFHGLVEQHRALVCGMNLALLDGVVEALGCEGASAQLDPAPGRCCVTVVRAAEPDGPAKPRP
jgi:predicted ArsR family transcriptional regulator